MAAEIEVNKEHIASLPMYDWPELRQANDALWSTVRARLASEGIDAPARLARDGNDDAYWTAPNLLLGQTCGYPLATRLKGKVRYVATPIYSVEGCAGPQYSSAIVVKDDSDLDVSSFSSGTFTYNSNSSLSGYRAIRAMFGEPAEVFADTVKSNGHRYSARMIADGGADVAAIDAVCWSMLQQFEAETASKLRVIGWTAKRPSLPMITSLNTNDETLNLLRDVLKSMAHTPEARALAITGFEEVPISEYDALSTL